MVSVWDGCENHEIFFCHCQFFFSSNDFFSLLRKGWRIGRMTRFWLRSWPYHNRSTSTAWRRAPCIENHLRTAVDKGNEGAPNALSRYRRRHEIWDQSNVILSIIIEIPFPFSLSPPHSDHYHLSVITTVTVRLPLPSSPLPYFLLPLMPRLDFFIRCMFKPT